MSLRIFALVFLGALPGLTGCSHYQLGTGGRLAFATLYIEPVANHTQLPQAHAAVGTQLREAFLQDGRVSLANSAGAADATLEIVISDYHREVASVREIDTGLARKFTLTLGATCTLRDRRTGSALFTKRLVNVQRDAFTDGGQLQSEYQTLPLLAAALATKIAHAVLDVW
jgi:hypothetical protein